MRPINSTVRMIVAAVACSASVLSSGCLSGDAGENGPSSSLPRVAWFAPRALVPAGTSLSVRLTSGVSSKTAHRGDSWSGVVAGPIYVNGKAALPAGTEVRGTVTGAREAEQGTRAMIDLQVDRVLVHGREVRLTATTDAIVAGSPRARNLGAIAGGVAAGALLGKVIGGDGHDAAVGGVLGGAAATGAVMASKGYQVEVKSGTVLTFTVSEPVAMQTEER